MTHMVGGNQKSLCGGLSSLLVYFQDLKSHPCEDPFLLAESGLLPSPLDWPQSHLKMKTSAKDTSRADPHVTAEENCVRNQTNMFFFHHKTEENWPFYQTSQQCVWLPNR